MASQSSFGRVDGLCMSFRGMKVRELIRLPPPPPRKISPQGLHEINRVIAIARKTYRNVQSKLWLIGFSLFFPFFFTPFRQARG